MTAEINFSSLLNDIVSWIFTAGWRDDDDDRGVWAIWKSKTSTEVMKMFVIENKRLLRDQNREEWEKIEFPYY